jgi:AAA+ superfamily predicted ATPase
VGDLTESVAVLDARTHALLALRRVGLRYCLALEEWTAPRHPGEVITWQVNCCLAHLGELTGPLPGVDDVAQLPIPVRLDLLDEYLAVRVAATEASPRPTPLMGLERSARLTTFEVELLLLAALSEESLAWATLFGLLADNPAIHRPLFQHAVNLGATDRETSARQERELLEGALLMNGLVRLEPPDAPLAMRSLHVPAEIWKALCGFAIAEPIVMRSLAPTPAVATAPILTPGLESMVQELAERARSGEPLRLVLRGPSGTGRHTIARHLASTACVPLVELRLPSEHPSPEWLAAAIRHALVRGAALLLEAPEGLATVDLQTALPPTISWFVVAPERCDVRGRALAGAIRLRVPRPGLAERTRLWSAIAGSGGPAPDELARRFSLSGGEIMTSFEAASAGARLERRAHPSIADLAAAIRERPAREVDALVRRRRPRAGWDDLVLAPEMLVRLRELAGRVPHHDTVFDQWRVASHTGRQQGTLALFVGPSGTGKTLAAEAVAAHLALDLYCVDMSQMVSKYVGETEKHFARLFDALEGAPAVLFFDEADGVFGKRTETRDAHDRYANLEVSYLLQRLETFTGVAILASNLRQNIDTAFMRRMDVVLEFTAPDTEARARIWGRHLRCNAPLAADLDIARLAEIFPVSGANIRNAVVSAAFNAAASAQPIGSMHLIAALRHEYAKLGKAFPSGAWSGRK